MSKPLLNVLLTGFNIMLLLFSVTLQAADDNAYGPHIVSKQTRQSGCNECHINTPELKNDGILNTNGLPVDFSQFKQNDNTMCLSCHTQDHFHKEVVGKIDFQLPADMPVNPDTGHICQTCHYTHGKLDSDQPRANVNFIDTMFDTERLHKSFLLRRNNNDGGLCLTCHVSSDMSK